MQPLIKIIKRNLPVYLLISPCIILIALMMIYPVYQTLRFSLSEVEIPSFHATFIGLDNFIRVFAKDEIQLVFKTTFIWVVGTVILRFLFGFWAALTFNNQFKGGVVLRVLCLLPWTVPSIVAANLWRWIFQSDTGLLNGFLRANGLGNLTQNWLGNANIAEYSVLLAYTWAGFPFVMLMLLAGMQGIPKEIYEAGKIDGANSVQLFVSITLPTLKPIIIVVLLLEIIQALNSFDMLMAMTGGGPGGATEVMGLFIYRLSFTNFDFGGASTVSTTLLIFAILFIALYGVIMKRREDS